MSDKAKFVEALEQQGQTVTEAPIVLVPRLSTWIYVQSTGYLYKPDGSFAAAGYSGHNAGVDNPELQTVANIGPIPVGLYQLGSVDEEKGPFTIHLSPDKSNAMFGRSGFLVHGDNKEVNHSASEGCIIMPRLARVALAGEATRGGSIKVIDHPAPAEKLT